MTSATKKCPYCAEEIKAEAIKCRFCGADLESVTPPQRATATPRGGAGLALGITALIFGVLAFVISWIPFLGLLGLPLSGLGVVLGVVGLAIGISAKRGSAIGFSVAGGAVSALALALAFGSTLLVAGGAAGLSDAANRGRQRLSMADLMSIATANGMMQVDTGRYASSLQELQAAGYLDVVPTTDPWGNAYIYTVDGASYSVTSLGSDGVPGPPPPPDWSGAPYEPDLVLEDGRLTQAPGMQ